MRDTLIFLFVIRKIILSHFLLNIINYINYYNNIINTIYNIINQIKLIGLWEIQFD